MPHAAPVGIHNGHPFFAYRLPRNSLSRKVRRFGTPADTRTRNSLRLIFAMILSFALREPHASVLSLRSLNSMAIYRGGCEGCAAFHALQNESSPRGSSCVGLKTWVQQLSRRPVAMSLDRHVGELLPGRSTFDCFMSTYCYLPQAHMSPSSFVRVCFVSASRVYT